MHNVLGALRYMAEHGGDWSFVTHAAVWHLLLYGARSDSYDYVGFTQDELRAFLKHYDEVTRER